MANLLVWCFTVVLSLTCAQAKCPEASVLSPCTCLFGVLQCADLPTNYIDDNTLYIVFERMSQKLSAQEKHFDALYLTGTSITELKNNTFRDIVFDEIYVTGNSRLTRVDANAFNGTDRVTTKIDFISNQALSQSADNSLYAALSKLVNVEQVNLAQGNNLTKVPSYAFKPLTGNQDKLWFLSFQDSIQRISTRSFYHLNSLRVLSLLDTQLEHIPAHAFELEGNSSTRFQIDLSHNPRLTGASFDKDAFTGTNRPTDLILDEHITYLDQSVFMPFLNENRVNTIMHVNDKSINCSDSRNTWLRDVTVWRRLRLCEPVV